jgi:hypothetical protein
MDTPPLSVDSDSGDALGTPLVQDRNTWTPRGPSRATHALRLVMAIHLLERDDFARHRVNGTKNSADDEGGDGEGNPRAR